MTKFRICLGNSTPTTVLVLDNWFILEYNLTFSVHKLGKFSSNTGKLYFEGSVNLFIYIGDNKTLGLKYYAEIKDANFSE